MCCSIVHFLGKEMNGWTPSDRYVGGNARRLGWPVLARSAGVLTGPSKYPNSSCRHLPMPRGKLRKSVFDKYGMYVSSGYLALSGFAHLINCIRHVLPRSTLSLSQSEVFCTDREPASPSRELIQTSMC